MKRVIKTETQISQTGEAVLSALRSAWADVPYRREVVRLVDGKPGFVMEEGTTASPTRRLNAHVSKEQITRFAGMVSPEDAGRIEALIMAGTFEVEKALQAFEALALAADKCIQPKTWEEAAALGAPSLATLVKYKGEEKAADLVFLLLSDYAKKFGRRSDLSEEIIRELAEDIVTQFRPLTVADLKVILNQGIQNKIFNLDYQAVFSLVLTKYDEKLEHAAGRSLDEHANTKPWREDLGPDLPSLSLAQQVAEVKLLSKTFDTK